VKWLEEPDDRKIRWCYEPFGGLGKTTFQKWIFQNYKGVAVLGGKAADMKNGIVRFKERTGNFPKIVLINIPKTFKMEYFCPHGTEEVKDMFFFSGKYGSKDEDGMVDGPPPVMIIFANQEPPDLNTMAADRWVIIRLPDGPAKETKEVVREYWDDNDESIDESN
jgi:hypothetical protein